MNKIIISPYGSGIAVGLEGDESFVERQLNRFYNYGAMARHGEFHRESPSFGYFISNEFDMVKALSSENFVRFQMDGTSKLFKKNPKAMEEAALTSAQTSYDAFERESFMSRRADDSARICGMSANGRAESWEDDFKPAR